jgi:hypothetical protein
VTFCCTRSEMQTYPANSPFASAWDIISLFAVEKTDECADGDTTYLEIMSAESFS